MPIEAQNPRTRDTDFFGGFFNRSDDVVPLPSNPYTNSTRPTNDLPGFNFEDLLRDFTNNFGGVNPGRGIAGARGFLDNFLNTDLSLNPEFLQNIESIQSTSGGEYQDFQNRGLDIQSLILNNPIAELIAGLGNQSLPGGGGGGFSFSGFGGGGSSTNSGSIADIFKNLPQFQAREIDTNLKRLPPEIQQQLDRVKQAQLENFENQARQQSQSLVADLFGRGVNRSTVAGEFANRLQENQNRGRLDIESADIERRLGLQTGEADRSLQAQLSQLGEEGSSFRTGLQSATSQKIAEIGAAAQERSARIGAAATASAASASARASIENARLGALANIFNTQVGGLTDIFRTESGAFGDRQGSLRSFADLFGNLALGEQGNFIDQAGIASGLFEGQQNRFLNAQLGNQGNLLDFLSLLEQGRSREQQGILTREGFDLERELARFNAQQADRNRPSFWDKLLGAGSTLGVAALSGSDENIKRNIKPYKGPYVHPSKLNEIDAITFDYLWEDGINRNGVIAQKLLRVCPEAVSINNGLYLVDYQLLTCALINGYKAYMNFVEETYKKEHSVKGE